MARRTVPEFRRTIKADGSGNLDSTNPDGNGDSSPLAPTNLSVFYVSDTSLGLTWTDNATNELNYELDRSLTGTGGWTALPDPAANATSATSTGLTVDTQYFYRLRAVNASGNSSYATGDAITTAGMVVLTGSGFGATGATVTNSDEFTYTDTDGTPIADGAGTPYKDNTISFNNPMLVDRNIALTGRTGSMRGAGKCQIQPQQNKSTQIYVTWFLRHSEDLEDPLIFDPVAARSDKIIRIWDNTLTGNTRISWTKQHMTYEDPLGSSPDFSNGVNNAGKVDQFQRYEIFAEKGIGFQTYVDGVAKTATTDYGDNFPGVGLFPEMFGYDMSQESHLIGGSSTFSTNVAEWAALAGHARVEFSNTAAWGTSGAFKRYRQTHSSWADGEIQIINPFYSDLDQSAGNLFAHIVLSDGSVVDYGTIN